MAAWGIGLIIVGAFIVLAGIGGFMDTRKVDRRFKTGYKDNEPDTRNFGRAGRLLLYGVGVCVIGAAINTVGGPKDEAPLVAATSDQSAPATHSPQAPASDITESTGDVAASNSPVAQAPESDSGVAVDGASQSSDAIVSAPGSQEPPSQNSDSHDNSTPAVQGRTFSTSFDCKRAKADDEIAICGDAGLAAMDRQLGQLYNSAMQTVADSEALKRSESDWVITRHMCNSDIECLRHAYGERIGQFMGSLGSKPLVATDSQAERE